MIAKGEGEGEGWTGSLGLVDAICCILEWISNEVLLYSTGHYSQSLGVENDGRWHEKKNVCIYNWLTMMYSRN